MTIGEKIAHLRQRAGLSQETLAEKLSVSRQSVSKWEIDGALPQIDKILQMCDFFSVSADELLRNGVILKSEAKGKNKYFGTDGFRGEANLNLTPEQAFKVGRFLGWYAGSEYNEKKSKGERARIVIGKDTRLSSYMLEYSIASGIIASGADAYMLHVTTTPSVSYVTRQEEFDYGIMITASHNPFYDNGIKVINRFGEKLGDLTTSYIESYIDGDMSAFEISGEDLPLAKRDKIGKIIDYSSGRNRYVGYLISLASNSYKGLRIGIDSANGASWMIARAVFDALGAKTVVIGAEPNGLNINEGCGSTHIENVSRLVRENHLDLGFAFDGDADRCIAVDENGNEVDGDKILYLLAKRLKGRGMLNKNTVVSTVMSNSALALALKKEGIANEKTDVGDRFVYESMQKNDFSLGGEESGHIIIKKYATTGDGILTAIMICEELCDKKSTLSKLCEGISLYPKKTQNFKVKNKDEVLSDESVLAESEKIEREISGKGRILLRKSGTEPLIRVTVESESEELCASYLKRMEAVIVGGGYVL